MNLAPKTTAAFDDLIAALQEARDEYVLDPRRFSDPLDVVEGFRYIGNLLSCASEFFLESDPDHPRLLSVVWPGRKLQGDNPDAIYHYARLRADRTYRITGRIEGAAYTSFTVHGPDPDGGMAGAVLADRNDRDLVVADDGSYEVVLSATRHDGNWIALHPETHSILVRHYFEQSPSVQNDPAAHVVIDIETLDVDGPPGVLDDEVFARRLAEGVAFLRQTTTGQRIPDPGGSGAPFASPIVNELPKPFNFAAAGLPDVPGANDIHYASCRWEIQPDEALVITGRMPAGPFANMVLFNNHMQTLEYRGRTGALNNAQIRYEDDGSYRVVLAHHDPGVANWLDPGGHTSGTLFCRFLLPDDEPEQPRCAVLPLAEVGRS